MSYGYPDYSRTQSQASNNLGSYFGTKGSDPTTGRLDCLGYAYLTIALDDQGNSHFFTSVVTFYDDFGLTNIVSTSTWIIVPGSRQSYQIPVTGRYCQVVCSHIIFGDTENIGCLVYGSNNHVPDISGPQRGQPFMIFGGSLGASSNIIVPAQTTYQGGAVLAGSTDSGTKWFAQIEYFNLVTASFSVLTKHNQALATASEVDTVALPPCPVRINVFNFDAVARTVIVSVGLL